MKEKPRDRVRNTITKNSKRLPVTGMLEIDDAEEAKYLEWLREYHIRSGRVELQIW